MYQQQKTAVISERKHSLRNAGERLGHYTETKQTDQPRPLQLCCKKMHNHI